MSDDLRHLHNLHESLTIPRPWRIAGTVIFALVIGLFASPASQPWMLYLFTAIFLLIVLAVGLHHRRNGMRTNHYAPMKPDSETPRALGGTQAPPTENMTPDEKVQRFSVVAAPGIYLMVFVSQWITNDVVGWLWAALVVITVFGVAWRYFALTDSEPMNYVPLDRVFATEQDWTPPTDVEAVAAALYAATAVPGGRQVRQDVLIESVAPLGIDGPALKSALDTLVAERRAVQLRDRRDADTVLTWITLTEEGRDRVQTGVPV